MITAFDEHFLTPYDERVGELILEHIDDPQGFYRADAALREELGLTLVRQNHNALVPGIRRGTL